MKKNLMAVAFVVSTAIAAAQGTPTVTFTKVLDTIAPAPGGATGNVHGITYVPSADKFISARNGTAIEIYNGLTGAFETNMSVAGTTPSGLGFFALTATQNGVVYAQDDGGKDIYRWASVTDPAPVRVYETAPALARMGYTGTDESGNVTIAFTGDTTDGPVHFYSDTFPFSSTSFAFNESPDLDAKSGLAINPTGNVAFTIGETQARSLKKFVKTDGVWGAAAWVVGTDAATYPPGGPLAYDSVNDILFHMPMISTVTSPWHKKLTAYRGATGEKLGEITADNAPNGTAGRQGGFAIAGSTAGTGTVFLATQGVTATSSVFYRYTYVLDNSSVSDWSLYQQ